MNVFDYLTADVTISGTLPKIPEGAKVSPVEVLNRIKHKNFKDDCAHYIYAFMFFFSNTAVLGACFYLSLITKFTIKRQHFRLMTQFNL